ncbi:MAG TPA: CoA-binding protein [Candidatus Kapabacteria bacterium]|nr:CoA-binding protein [Candidatus Kapabacteria bacterium]
MNYKDIFDKYKNIAVVGMSNKPGKAAHNVPMFMHEHNYNVIPVNPLYANIKGLHCYKSLTEIPYNIDIINVFRPSADAEIVVQDAIQRFQQKGDIKVIWLQEGIFSMNGKKLAEENGVIYIENVCMYKAYVANL